MKKNKIKALLVCSGNSNSVSPFIAEQAEFLMKHGIIIDYYFIKGKGFYGYLSNLKTLRNKIKEFNPDVVHAHYGLSGLLAGLQCIKLVLVTLHGSDVFLKQNLLYSKLASRLAFHTILVNQKMIEIIKIKKKYSIIPCGVSLEKSYPLKKSESRIKMNLDQDKKYILFSSSFDRPEKNVDLAFKALSLLSFRYIILELKGFSRIEVNLLLNAVDLVLMTSIYEGSPQVIKEAMACNCPIVSTDVGDVKWIIGNIEGCYLTSLDPKDVAKKIDMAFDFVKNNGKTEGRKRIIDLGLNSDTISKKIIRIYEKILD